MRKVLCALLCVLVAVPAWGESQKWAKYFNARFGYSIEYPDIFPQRREPDNGDGVWLKSKDGKTSLTISGGYNILMKDGAAMLESRETKGAVKKESGSEWFRLVRRDGGLTVHEYGVVDDETWASFIFTYSGAKDFKSVISRMERTLRLGKEN